LIGGFGGKLEPGESAAAAVCRELSEETSLQPLVDDLLYIGITDVLSDHQLQEVKIRATFFHLAINETTEVVAHEGKVIYMTEQEVYVNLHRLTPATRAYFETVIMRNEHVPANRS
jgi:8-oxo-dGTP pyrophosphatase MutT (NUDIX family)